MRRSWCPYVRAAVLASIVLLARPALCAPAVKASPTAATATAATTAAAITAATTSTAAGAAAPSAVATAPAVTDKAIPYRITGVTTHTESKRYYEYDSESSTERKKLVREARVTFSLPTRLSDVSEALTVMPQVRLRWAKANQVDPRTIRIPGDFTPGQSYHLIVNRVFQDAAGKHWIDPRGPTFVMTRRSTSIEWDGVKDRVERESRQLVHLALRNVDAIRLGVTRVPPVALLPGEPQLSETIDLKSALRTWAATSLRLRGILSKSANPFAPMLDGQSTTEAEVFSEPGSQDKDRHVSIPLEWRNAADIGGTDVITATSSGITPPVSATPLLLQVTDLALSYKHSPSQLVCWVTRLGSGDVVPGAHLFATTLDAQLVALGTTDHDGLLTVDDGSALPTLDVTSRAAAVTQSPLLISRISQMVALSGTSGHAASDMVWVDLDGDILDLPPRLQSGWAAPTQSSPDVRSAHRSGQHGYHRRHGRAIDGPTLGEATTRSQDAGALTTQEANATRALVFTERGIYRPGDTIHFKVTVRRFVNGTVEAPVGPPTPRCKVVLKDARGNESWTGTPQLSSFGTCAGDVPLSKHGPIGAWTLNVSSPDGAVAWSHTTFRVEDFVAPRHKVEITFRGASDTEAREDAAHAAHTRPGAARWREKSIQAVIHAQYYAGGPVRHGKVRWRATLVESRHDLTEPRGFVCGSDLPGEPDLLESGEATLDAAGQLVLDMPMLREVEDGRRALKIFATALDFDARAASSEATFTKTPRYLVGISAHPAQIESHEPIVVRAIVVDHSTGKRVKTGVVEVSILRETYTDVERRDETGDLYKSWEEMMVPETTNSVGIINGEARIEPDFGRWGRHQVTIAYTAPDGLTYASTTTFTVGEPDGEGEEGEGRSESSRSGWSHYLPVTSDRPDYAPGDVAHLTVVPSRAVTSYLVTVEREGVRRTRRIAARPGVATIDVPIQEEDQPNIYVSVIAVHPREGYPSYATEADTGMPAVSMGYVTLPVHREHGDLRIAFRGAGEGQVALPRERRKLVVRVTDREGHPVHTEVALGVVDESVLALTGYPSPVLGPLFVQVLPLMVRTSDPRISLTPQSPYRAFMARPLTGGDGGGKYNLTREWFDPVALFAPSLVTDAKGEVAVEFTIPDTMTQYRVYAVACDAGTRHGAASTSLVVRKPFYVEAGLPRCFTDGDRGTFGVSLVNGTERAQSSSLAATATGGLDLAVVSPASQVPAHDRVTVPVRFTAHALPGHPMGQSARITLAARLGSPCDAVALIVPVRSRYVMRTQMVRGMAGSRPTTFVLDVPVEVAQLPADAARLAVAHLTASHSPLIQLREALSYVLRYPYGCIEQTSSGVIPLAALRSLLNQVGVPGISVAQADQFLAPGIDRILSMQTREGGFAYWPGEQTPHPWGSVYGTLALTLAKQAGAAVPQAELERALKFIAQGSIAQGISEENAAALKHYVLALNGRASPNLEEALAATLSSLVKDPNERENALILCLAAEAAGKHGAAKAALDKVLGASSTAWTQPSSFWGTRDFDDYCFYSRTRAQGIACAALAAIEPTHPALGVIAGELLEAVAPHTWWMSTQECAWALIGLARYLGNPRGSGSLSRVMIRGPGLTSTDLTVPDTGTARMDLDGPSILRAPAISLVSQDGPAAFVTIDLEYPWRGPDVDPAKAPITRQYVPLAGGDAQIRVGDLVQVKLRMRLPHMQSYLALTDPLPAGLVAINSELKTEEQPPAVHAGHDDEDDGNHSWSEWVSPFIPSHLEIRDDRVVAFRDSAWGGVYEFTYVARAVCEGTFVAPPATLEPMYKPRDAVFSTETVLKVLPTAHRGE